MFNRTPVNINEDSVEKLEVERVDGIFKNDRGEEVSWHGYRMKTKINGVVFKWKLDKVYNDTMDEVIEEENKVIINNKNINKPKDILYGKNDHRIVMALSVMLSVYGGVIDGVEAVNKSYPNFFEDLKSLGIEVDYE